MLPCPVILADAAHPTSDIEGLVRFVLGHRRLTHVLAAAIDTYSLQSTLCQTWAAVHLLDGHPLADTGASYVPVGRGGTELGEKRYALTTEGVNSVWEWLDRGEPDAPIGGTVGGQRAVLLTLAGSGTGPLQEHTLRSTKVRHQRLSAMYPDHPELVALLCHPNTGGLERERIQDVLAELVRIGAGCVLELADAAMHAQRVGQYVRHLASTGLASEIAPKATAHSGNLAILQPEGWTAIRRYLRRSGNLPYDERDFGLRLATRSSVRRSLPTDIDTDAGRSERKALERTQAIIGSLLVSHPRSIWSTASLLSMPVTLHADGSPRAGHPTSDAYLDGSGQPAGPVRGHRTPDGAVWFDPHQYPDVLIEYEADGSRLRIVEHLEAALWQSSTSGRLITLVIGTTGRSENGVRRAIDSYVSTRQPWVHRRDWPYAHVRVRIARASTLCSACPIHGEVDDEWLIRA